MVKNMPLAPKLDKKYTYADYLTWPENERWELIKGGMIKRSTGNGR